MTHADPHPSSGAFAALTNLIRQHAENPDSPPTLDDDTAGQVTDAISKGAGPALLAAMAATTGDILNDWNRVTPGKDQLLADLEALTSQPGWSPSPNPALTSARNIVSDYASTPRPPGEDLTRVAGAGDASESADLLNAGLMMCLELLRRGRGCRAGAGE